MLSVTRPLDTRSFPFGQRPGVAHLASRTPSLCWGSKGPESAESARTWAYPSPPMSGPPNVPPRIPQEANQQCEGTALPSGSSVGPQNVFRERPQQQQQQRQQHQHPPFPRSYAHEPLPSPHGFARPEETRPLTPLYQPHPPRGPSSQTPYQQPHNVAPRGRPEGPFSMTSQTQVTDNQSFSPPKSQKKTKGHVASACVPCKRAHLRCDAQRPCSRCLSNGKEDACIDVQHKKRGRPRLREDRDSRYDPLRPPHYPDLSLRRPLSVYAAGGHGAPVSEDMLQRSQGYRQVEPPRSATLPPRHFVERVPDGSIYSPPPPPAGYPEPVAYLTMGMEFAKASPTFLDAIGAVNVAGRRLSNVVANSEASKILSIQNRLVGEQKHRKPNYLPPILGLGPGFQGIGFGTEDFARFPLNIQEQLAFVGPDGYARHYPLRMGLGKEGSFFFIVMWLCITPRYPPPLSAAPSRVPPAGPFHGTPGAPEGVGARAGACAAFDPIRHRVSESPMNVRSPLSLQNLAGHASPADTPRTGSHVSPYRVSAAAGHLSGPPEQPAYRPAASTALLSSFPARQGQQKRLQLPPIRAHSEQRPLATQGGYARPADERQGRVDIGGLVDRPEAGEGQSQ